MKYIEIPALSNLAQSLSHQGPECSVHVRMEAHEFSDVRPAHFNREEKRAGMNAPRTYGSYPSIYPGSLSLVWYQYDVNVTLGLERLVDDVIGLEECEVYSYTPEIESDPHVVGDFDSDDEEELGNGGDGDEYERADVGRNGAGWWDENVTFEFDDYDQLDEFTKLPDYLPDHLTRQSSASRETTSSEALCPGKEHQSTQRQQHGQRSNNSDIYCNIPTPRATVEHGPDVSRENCDGPAGLSRDDG
ncbi:hypothetical protein MPER_09403 [Moniliophthora perniciosa FA553]|nr:hypothetical protein MPER_09403 [Moniliophthora perniciosa FA553]